MACEWAAQKADLWGSSVAQWADWKVDPSAAQKADPWGLSVAQWADWKVGPSAAQKADPMAVTTAVGRADSWAAW